MREPKHREVSSLAQGHTGSRRQAGFASQQPALNHRTYYPLPASHARGAGDSVRDLGEGAPPRSSERGPRAGGNSITGEEHRFSGPRPAESNSGGGVPSSVFSKPSRRFWCTLESENHRSNTFSPHNVSYSSSHFSVCKVHLLKLADCSRHLGDGSRSPVFLWGLRGAGPATLP